MTNFKCSVMFNNGELCLKNPNWLYINKEQNFHFYLCDEHYSNSSLQQQKKFKNIKNDRRQGDG